MEPASAGLPATGINTVTFSLQYPNYRAVIVYIAVEVELRGQQKETETTTYSFVDRVELERDLQERTDHAEGMGNELRGARGRLEAAER